ncbi:MAG TPA: hypothetical protein VN039_13330 [Nitrospira sp.]|nr:hypothetical protein [Nitrospira sp.]
MDTPQKRFDTQYITSSQIRERVQVSRVTLHQRRSSGKLPGAIELGDRQTFIWERESIEPHIREWEIALHARRAG